MNPYRMQFAPGVWKPKLKPRLVQWLQPLRVKHQQRVQRLQGGQIEGASHVREALDRGEGVMIMPNHPSHADPFSIYMAADSIGTALYIMATWHVFHGKPWVTRWLLQSHGCFSVDREANDIGAFRQALDILANRQQPLVIFPEGEIYHCNDRVTPFRDGAAAIAVAAARRADRKIVCIPCALSYRYVDDPTPDLERLMGDLEEAIMWRRRPDQPLQDRIYHFAEALLAVKEIEYFGCCQAGSMADRIRHFREEILVRVEARHELKGEGQSVPERVKNARRTIMEKLDANGESTPADPQPAAELRQDMDDLFLVIQSFSYPGDYVIQRPSIERMAETLDKFEEDVLRRTTASIRGHRTVKVQLGEPIEVSGDRKQKGLASQLSRQVESAIQDMLVDMRGESVMI